MTAEHGLVGLAKVVAEEGAKHSARANVICPGFVRTPLVDKQIPEQAKERGISEAEVAKNVMLEDTVDGGFTTVEDFAEAALGERITMLFAAPHESYVGTSRDFVAARNLVTTGAWRTLVKPAPIKPDL